jgi:hypothetical protein
LNTAGSSAVIPCETNRLPLGHLCLAQAVGQRDLVDLPLVAHPARALLALATDRDDVNALLSELVEAAIEL